MNIWLDDQRKAPEGWVHLHNLEEVEQLIESARGFKEFSVDSMSFDFNLSHPKRGIDVMKYLAEQCSQANTARLWPKRVLYHSTDRKGIQMMRVYQEDFEKRTLPKLAKEQKQLI